MCRRVHVARPLCERSTTTAIALLPTMGRSVRVVVSSSVFCCFSWRGGGKFRGPDETALGCAVLPFFVCSFRFSWR